MNKNSGTVKPVKVIRISGTNPHKILRPKLSKYYLNNSIPRTSNRHGFQLINNSPQQTLINLTPVGDISPKFFADTTSENLGPISGVSLDSVAEITEVRIAQDHRAHLQRSMHHRLLLWTPQQTLRNLTPVGDILPKFFANTTSVNLGPISGALLDSVAEITEVKIVQDHQAHSQRSIHHWLFLWKQQERHHQRNINPPTHSGSLISDGNSLTNYHIEG